jgi:membrane-bound lytic murein transglycosylase D
MGWGCASNKPMRIEIHRTQIAHYKTQPSPIRTTFPKTTITSKLPTTQPTTPTIKSGGSDYMENKILATNKIRNCRKTNELFKVAALMSGIYPFLQHVFIHNPPTVIAVDTGNKPLVHRSLPSTRPVKNMKSAVATADKRSNNRRLPSTRPVKASTEQKKQQIEQKPYAEKNKAEQYRLSMSKTVAVPQLFSAQNSRKERDKEEPKASDDNPLRDYPELEFPLDDRRFKGYLRYFGARRQGFIWVISKNMTRYREIMEPLFRKHHLPLELMLLAGNESSFLPRLRSRKYAMGMWQIIALTGNRYGLRITPWLDERRDVIKSTKAMITYMKYLHTKFGSWPLAMAAYNCGERCVERMVQRCPGMTFWQMRRRSHCRVHSETNTAVPRLYALAYYWRNPIPDRRMPKAFAPLHTVTVRTPGPVSLADVAEAIGMPLYDLWFYNPELSTWATPPALRYPLRVPPAYATQLRDYFQNGTPDIRLISVKNSDQNKHILKDLARKYRIPQSALLQLNRTWSEAQFIKRSHLIVALPRNRDRWTNNKRDQQKLAELVRHVRRFHWHYPASVLFRQRSRFLKGPRNNRSNPPCYQVRKGDTWQDIANNFSIPIHKLQQYNATIRHIVPDLWLRLSPGSICPTHNPSA